MWPNSYWVWLNIWLWQQKNIHKPSEAGERPHTFLRSKSSWVASASEGLLVYPKITSGSTYMAWWTSVLKQGGDFPIYYSSINWLKNNCSNAICIHILMVICYIDYLCDFPPDKKSRLHWLWCIHLYWSFVSLLSTLILDSRDLREYLILLERKLRPREMEWAGQAPPSMLETELDSPGLFPGQLHLPLKCRTHWSLGAGRRVEWQGSVSGRWGQLCLSQNIHSTPYSVVFYNYFVYLYTALSQKWLKILSILISSKFCSLDWTLDNT